MNRACGAMHLATIEEKVAFYLLTYGFNIKRTNKKEKEEVLDILSFIKLIKRVKSVGRAKFENKFPPLLFRLDIFVLLTPIHGAKQ